MFLYENKEMLRKLEDECISWMGTPYKHRCYTKGAGCDCVGFAASVLVNVGLMRFDFKDLPNYARDYHLHETRSLLLEAVMKYLPSEVIPVQPDEKYELKDGDVLAFNFGKAAGHAGFWFNGWLYEAIDKIGVKKTLFKNSPWRDKIVYIVRVKVEV